MLKKSELEDILTKDGLAFFETEMSCPDDIPNMIYLKNNEISEIIKFADVNKIGTVLYCYNYFIMMSMCIINYDS